MCGLCGVFAYRTGQPVDRALLRQMTDIQAHRGPDGEGFYFDDPAGVGLGHRRLAIIDLSTGDQPMTNEDGSLWIVFNGEIYNYRELRADLQGQGHSFRTQSDTEVILHAYEEWGPLCPRCFNGIFAFALWDVTRRRLFLARDHFGVKPLYYYNDGDRILFGSELKAILCDPTVPRRLDLDGLNLCLTFRHTPSPWTLLRGIRKLPPASYLVATSAGVREGRYWENLPEIDRGPREEAWVEQLGRGLEEAVTRQMVSDVPLGISLSGGVDSGTILALMSARAEQPVHAFTVGFEGGEKTNEITEAQEAAWLFGADFHSQVITQRDYEEFFQSYLWHLEEPIGNESAAAYYFVARLAHGTVKVLLNGQGADEPFAGYPRYLGIAYGDLLRKMPAPLLAYGVRPLVNALPRQESLKRAVFSLAEQDLARRFLNVYTITTPDMKDRLFRPEMKAALDLDRPQAYVEEQLKRTPVGTPLEKMLYLDARTQLPDNLLLCEDKMAMATGIEARVPFLDTGYMAIAERIPGQMKIRRGRFKYIHKQVCERWLPASIVHRRKKGFSNPMDRWLGQKLGDFLTDLMNDSGSLSGHLFDLGEVQHLLEFHRTRREDYTRFLYLLLSVEMWNQVFRPVL